MADESRTENPLATNGLDAPRVLGYGTNVHPGVSMEQIKRNLRTHAIAVKERISPDQPMPIGLWLPASAARELREPGRAEQFRDWLIEHGLRVFTLNGFPKGDFHRGVVKHRVYQPTWADIARVNYTRDLVEILAVLTPEGGEGGISTLPIGWGGQISPRDEQAAASQIHEIAWLMAEVEHRRGRYLHLDIEPEPGCHLQCSSDLVRFFRMHLFSHPEAKIARRHLRICHDVCHAAVMFENQEEMIAAYDRIGATIGKVQISSAPRAVFDGKSPEMQQNVREALEAFREPRYLHQTMVRDDPNAEPAFYEDLPDALQKADAAGEWRVHFHVPVYLDHVGPLATTSASIGECLDLLRDYEEVRHFEVETYAWSVLPEEHRVDDASGGLAGGITRELEWACRELGKIGPQPFAVKSGGEA